MSYMFTTRFYNYHFTQEIFLINSFANARYETNFLYVDYALQ
jgi:hypothetical protein